MVPLSHALGLAVLVRRADLIQTRDWRWFHQAWSCEPHADAAGAATLTKSQRNRVAHKIVVSSPHSDETVFRRQVSMSEWHTNATRGRLFGVNRSSGAMLGSGV